MVIRSYYYALSRALAGCETPTAARAPLAPTGPRGAVLFNQMNRGVSLSTFNACNGDLVSGTGDIHTVLSETPDGSGGFHFAIKTQFQNIHLTGSPSGASYVSSEESSLTENISAAQLGGEETNTLSFKLIGQGTTPSVYLKALFHITVNAAGSLTSFVDNFSVVCQGQ